MSKHKNKTLAAFLALFLGSLGTHRFYLAGTRDPWAWLHLSSLAVSGILLPMVDPALSFFALLPFIFSMLAAILGTLVIGLTSDEKWDAKFNPNSGINSNSRGFLAVIVVLAFGSGAVGLIATIARSFDLLYTGGAFG